MQRLPANLARAGHKRDAMTDYSHTAHRSPEVTVPVFRNLSIAKKRYAGFAAVLLVLLVLGLLALAKMGSISDGARSINQEVVPSIGVVDDIAMLAQDYRKDQFRHPITNPKKKAELFEEMPQTVAKIDKLFADYEKLIVNDRDRQLRAAAQAAWKAYLADSQRSTELVKAGDIRGAVLAIDGTALSDVEDTLEAWADYNDKLGDEAYADSVSTYDGARSLIIGFIVFAVLLAGAIGFLVARSITGGIGQVLRAARGISAGDLEQEITVQSRDEVGQLADEFRTMTVYLGEMAGNAERVAQGDLTAQVTPQSDRDALGNALHTMVGKLRELVGSVQSSASTLSSASQEMASTSEEAGRAVGEIASAVSDVAQGAERQVRSVEQAKRASEEVSAATEASARSARETADAAAETRLVAAEGEQAVAQATEAMRQVRESSGGVTATMQQLSTKSEQIGGIVETITGIASQTNLLALNAAIEAARAGEQGRGFAVVAEEVRKLAEESQSAAATIATLVEEIQGETTQAVAVVEETNARTEEGSATVEQARDAFSRIGVSVDGMTGRVDAIAAAVQQIAVSAQQVQDDMTEVAAVAEESSASSEQVSASTEETSASAQEIASSAQQLAGTASELEELVGRFTLA